MVRITQNIFVQDFNLGFGNRKTDVCSFCTRHMTKITCEKDEEKKRTLVTELLVHRSRSCKFYKLMSTKLDESTLMISFDLMQNQALLKSLMGEAYYARQLWLYVLGIIKHKPSGKRGIPGEQSRKDVHFYTRGEQEMGRGANQVTNALKHFLDDRLQRSPEVTKVVLLSDSCVGQNMNCIVLGMLNLVSTAQNVAWVMGILWISIICSELQWGKSQKIAIKQYSAYHRLKCKNSNLMCEDTGLWISTKFPYFAA